MVRLRYFRYSRCVVEIVRDHGNLGNAEGGDLGLLESIRKEGRRAVRREVARAVRDELRHGEFRASASVLWPCTPEEQAVSEGKRGGNPTD